MLGERQILKVLRKHGRVLYALLSKLVGSLYDILYLTYIGRPRDVCFRSQFTTVESRFDERQASAAELWPGLAIRGLTALKHETLEDIHPQPRTPGLHEYVHMSHNALLHEEGWGGIGISDLLRRSIPKTDYHG